MLLAVTNFAAKAVQLLFTILNIWYIIKNVYLYLCLEINCISLKFKVSDLLTIVDSQKYEAVLWLGNIKSRYMVSEIIYEVYSGLFSIPMFKKQANI